jgi:DNA-binding IclR family transcriptional regulator
MVDDGAEDYPVGSVRTTFRVIEALVATGGAGVTELAGRLDRSKSGVHKHLVTLRRLGYVYRDGDDYRASLQFLDVGSRIRQQLRLARAASGDLVRLGELAGETAVLVAAEADRAVQVSLAGDAGELPLREGATAPLHASAGGKAILAGRDPEARRRILAGDLPARTSRTITDPDELTRELRSVRDRGLAFDRGEQFSGVRGVGAPIHDASGDPVGAVAVLGPASRMGGKRLEEDVTGLVVSTANAIEVALLDE